MNAAVYFAPGVARIEKKKVYVTFCIPISQTLRTRFFLIRLRLRASLSNAGHM